MDAAGRRRERVIPRVDVLGVGISAIDMTTAVDEIAAWIEHGERHYVCVTGEHGVMESQRDPEL
jgi:N-acetylglucosaminyldiphosphoundecaprenol N-acetyl-beta-D-mannosaminyltransferase